MAPKRKTEEPAQATAVAGRVTRSSGRVTRSSASSGTKFIELPVTRKSPNKKKKVEKKAESKGKGKPKEASTSEGEKAEAETFEDVPEASNKIVVIIEHCKQCNSFKTRALQVKEALEKSDVDVIVKVNPEKPRKGCFEIRVQGGKQFISLLDMKRPFKPMKELDMDEVISGIVNDLSNANGL